MSTTRRRPLGTGPQTPETGVPVELRPPRVLASQADLDTDLHVLHLPDLAALRIRGVLGTQAQGE